MSKKPCTTKQAADAVGIARLTLQRWIAAGKLRAPKTQLVGGVGMRLWSEEDISRLHKVKQENYCKGRGRKPKPKR